MFCDIGAALPLVTSGKLRALATSSADRELLLRDVPTLQEAGSKDFEMTVWSAAFVPAKTPKDTIAKLNELLARRARGPGGAPGVANTGGRSRGSTPDELRAFVDGNRASGPPPSNCRNRTGMNDDRRPPPWSRAATLPPMRRRTTPAPPTCA